MGVDLVSHGILTTTWLNKGEGYEVRQQNAVWETRFLPASRALPVRTLKERKLELEAGADWHEGTNCYVQASSCVLTGLDSYLEVESQRNAKSNLCLNYVGSELCFPLWLFWRITFTSGDSLRCHGGRMAHDC